MFLHYVEKHLLTFCQLNISAFEDTKMCLNFREFLIFRLFTKFRIREFTFFFSSSIGIIIFARFWNSLICPREIREN